VEQWSLSELTVELGTSCYAGVLLLQAMGLGGWMFNGVDPFAMLGASGNPEVPGLGFRYDKDERWPYPNPTGLEGVMEGYCPPITETCELLWMHSARASSAQEVRFIPTLPDRGTTVAKYVRPHKCTANGSGSVFALQAQYVYDTFGKFPGTVPSCSSLCICKRITSISSFMTSSTNLELI